MHPFEQAARVAWQGFCALADMGSALDEQPPEQPAPPTADETDPKGKKGNQRIINTQGRSL